MLQNAYFLAKIGKKIGADTAENERHFAENLLEFAEILSPNFGEVRKEENGDEKRK